MAKILLVEDDNNLREIYQARLQAEGYDVVAASDGEEALVVAKNEEPDLVISDVMMPKISGFEMLDILRNTEKLRDVKVIMLTALGQAEDQSRADKLGADRYLVKSQVTLEDIVNVAKDLLVKAGAIAGPEPVVAPTPAPAPAATETAAISVATAPPEPVATTPAVTEPAIVAQPVTPTSESAVVDPISVAQLPIETPVVAPVVTQPTVVLEPVAAPVVPEPVAVESGPALQPVVTEPVQTPDPVTAQPAEPVADATAPVSAEPVTRAQEEQVVEAQIEDFVDNQPGTAPLEVAPASAPVDIEPEVTASETPAPATAQPAAGGTTTPEQEQALTNAMGVFDTDNTPAEPVNPPASNNAAPETNTETAIPDGGITHKKIIRPLSDADPNKKSLDQLLAEEEGKQIIQSPSVSGLPVVAPEPTPPAPVVTPQAAPEVKVTPPPANPTDFDPNSIAL